MLRIDRIAPVSTASPARRLPMPAAANTTPVTVSIAAADSQGGSGVQSISCPAHHGNEYHRRNLPRRQCHVRRVGAGHHYRGLPGHRPRRQPEPARSLTIRIESAAAPAFSASVSVSPAVLWPPDRRFDSVHAQREEQQRASAGCASSRCPSPATSGWAARPTGREGSSVKLRAERDDRGNGRVYTLTYTLVDEAGNTTKAVDTVKVPKYWPQWHWGHWDHIGTASVRTVARASPSPSPRPARPRRPSPRSRARGLLGAEPCTNGSSRAPGQLDAAAQPALRIDRHHLDAARPGERERLRRRARTSVAPDRQRGSRAGEPRGAVVVVADPDHGEAVAAEAGEPGVALLVGGAGLAGDGDLRRQVAFAGPGRCLRAPRPASPRRAGRSARAGRPARPPADSAAAACHPAW